MHGSFDGVAFNNVIHISFKSCPIRSLRTFGRIRSARGTLGFETTCAFFVVSWVSLESMLTFAFFMDGGAEVEDEPKAMFPGLLAFGLVVFAGLPEQLLACTSKVDFGNISKQIGHSAIDLKMQEKIVILRHMPFSR